MRTDVGAVASVLVEVVAGHEDSREAVVTLASFPTVSADKGLGGRHGDPELRRKLGVGHAEGGGVHVSCLRADAVKAALPFIGTAVG